MRFFKNNIEPYCVVILTNNTGITLDSKEKRYIRRWEDQKNWIEEWGMNDNFYQELTEEEFTKQSGFTLAELVLII